LNEKWKYLALSKTPMYYKFFNKFRLFYQYFSAIYSVILFGGSSADAVATACICVIHKK